MNFRLIRLNNAHRLILIIVALVIALQFLLWQNVRHDAFWGPDPGAKLLQVVNFSLRDQSIEYPGQILDPTHQFAPFYSLFTFEVRGKFFGVYSPVFIALSALFYRLIGINGLYVLSFLSSIATMLLTSRLMKVVAPNWVPASPLVVGLASPLLFYAMNFWEHMIGVALATGALLAMWNGVTREGAANKRWLFSAGLLAGLGYAVRPELGVWCLAMLLGAVWVWPFYRKQIVILYSLGAVVVAGLLELYELFTFGALVRRNISENYTVFMVFNNLPEWIGHQVSLLMAMLLPVEQRTWWLLLWAMLGLLVTLSITLRKSSVHAFVYAVALLVVAIMGILLFLNFIEPQVYDDLIQTFPLTCFLVVGYVAPRRLFSTQAGSLMRFLLLTIGFFLLFVTFTTFNDGASQWGPRYLMAVIPALTVILFGWLEQIRYECMGPRLCFVNRLLCLMLLVLSCYAQYLGWIELRVQTAMQGDIADRVNALPEKVVVVNTGLLTMVLAPVFQNKLYLKFERPAQIETFVQLLHRQGVHQFAYATLLLIDSDNYDPLPDFARVLCCHVIADKPNKITYLRRIRHRNVHVHLIIQRYQIQ
ncbi:MAG: hypothetical protein U0350_30635 [Caldilineaceae bacterium]